MPESTPERPLTPDERAVIYQIIWDRMDPEQDRDPREVIRDDRYKGDEDKYLKEMAALHGVPIDK